MSNMVSIVVPVYNVEKYLRECIDSLLCQSYNNIEIILVDDGSKDASGDICDEYAQLDDRIIVVHKKNEGLGYARNTGIEVAKGEFVVFVDSDDYVDSDMIEQLLLPIVKEGADTCIGGFRRVDDQRNILYTETYIWQHFEEEDVYNSFFMRILGSSPSEHDSFRMSVWNAIYSLDIINNNNIRFPSERKLISEDLIFDSDYYKYAKKVSVIETASYNYRVAQGSLTNSYRENKIVMICDLYEEMEKRVLETFKDSDSAVMRLQKLFFVNLRGCIAQEKQSVSKKRFKNMVMAMRNICCNSTVRKVIKAYPANELHFKQKVFVLLIKYKMIFTLCFVSNFGLI